MQPPGPGGPRPPGLSLGWGGATLPQDLSSARAPWFGRSHKSSSHRQRGGGGGGGGGPGSSGSSSGSAPPRGGGAGGPGGPGPAGPGGPPHGAGPAAPDALSVEDAVALVRRLPRDEPLPERLHRALRHLDSRAAALLLKDLSKAGLDERAIELFDWLRALRDGHALRALCDVYTYTAMISLCIYQQNVDRAVELLEEMRARGVERNVHTYTALMNVCIKCGKMSAALEIFDSMRAEGCTPNVVTYNTLIDVHGKLGQWDRAIGVIKLMRSKGVAPALRTYNTLIIACNMCNQPREALGVYQELLAESFTPNSTTYNALISAYGKLGQLDKVLEVYKDMVWKGLERSVITYSSLISACEKAGRWETALQLFDEMTRDGCTPNTVTYNSLITACGQGCQWEKAQAVFDQMQATGCTPDVVTYTSLISAYERGGQWQLALSAFQRMLAQGCRPDAIVYNAIIDAMWQTGVTWAQAKALELYQSAVKQGHLRSPRALTSGVDGAPAAGGDTGGGGGSRGELNLHALTAGVAMLSLYLWLTDIRDQVLSQGEGSLPASLAIVTDAGNSSREQGNFIIKEALSTTMAFWGAPFRPVQDRSYLGLLEASGPAVAQWVTSDAFSAQMASLFPVSASPAVADTPAMLAREASARRQCHDAFAAVARFEGSHSLQLGSMGAAYLGQRTALVSALLEAGSSLGVADEVIHDSVLLLDRALSVASGVPPELLPLVAGAALHLASLQGAADGAAGPGSAAPAAAAAAQAPRAEAVAAAMGLDPQALSVMAWRLQALLGGDTLAISTMRCLRVYLERMGYRFLDQRGIYATAGLPIMLAVEALFDMALLNCRPSAVAAAILYAERRARGAVPFWPTMLAKMTGYEDLASAELAVAVHTAQKLCRKVLYTQIYKAQATGLAGGGGGGDAAAAAAQLQALPGALLDARVPAPAPAGAGGGGFGGSAGVGGGGGAGGMWAPAVSAAPGLFAQQLPPFAQALQPPPPPPSSQPQQPAAVLQGLGQAGGGGMFEGLAFSLASLGLDDAGPPAHPAGQRPI
ncbi:hypothetical protein Rsub_10954 [Raphidocelis subcapitata]|uniref:PROP1-like PPR domain-containing protein n=1 Tax=Raphidocelis subcapitata TaxID=307507 RepID=A0A2V0PEK8_9CHLO|nr:hypothetical protein Rsub_10954 [Raphidocelis subcapitata]|eukprot:GBF98291.1 hypothetical protein Rsub_10954 [Raphidocelis subcapitata]